MCLGLNTKFPFEGGRRSCKRFDWWLHVHAVKRFRVKRCRKSNHELSRLMFLVNSECRLHAGGMCRSDWQSGEATERSKNVSRVVLCSIWGWNRVSLQVFSKLYHVLKSCWQNCQRFRLCCQTLRLCWHNLLVIRHWGCFYTILGYFTEWEVIFANLRLSLQNLKF